jgi:hypothetical protein
MSIQNDSEFKCALEKLSLAQQRHVASLFVENVLELSKDNRLKGVLSAARRDDISDDELIALRQAAKSASVESYTQCGTEGDWHCQAAHFVAEATVACIVVKADHPAWHTAMHARMARTCAGIAEGNSSTEESEALAQYKILADFLAQ